MKNKRDKRQNKAIKKCSQKNKVMCKFLHKRNFSLFKRKNQFQGAGKSSLNNGY